MKLMQVGLERLGLIGMHIEYSGAFDKGIETGPWPDHQNATSLRR